MNWFGRVGLGSALACGLACYSHSPLDSSPKAKADPRLSGVWRCVPPDAESSDEATVTVVADGEREYRITWREGEKDDHYRAFGSTVRDAPFLNVREDKAGEASSRPWVFIRYALLRSNILYAELADEGLFKEDDSSSSARAARATLERALGGAPGAVKAFAVCVRKGE
jgi:hypothetical protein